MVDPTSKLIQIVPYDQYLVERAEAVGHSVKGYDKIVVLPFAELFPDGKPIRFGVTWDKELETMRPDWNTVADLGRKWEKEVRTKELEKLVRQYQTGDENVLGDIEDALEVLAYSAARKFAFETHPDTAVFLNEAGQFDKYIPKAPDTEDPADERVEVKKMYVRFVPFSFSDEDIDEQFPESVKAALKTYNPDHKTKKGKKTLFSTWFFRRFTLDLKSLYKKYKGEPEKIMNREQYDKKGLDWSRTHTAIPDKTNLSVGDFTTKEVDWMSLVLESYPYDLGVNLRCSLLNIKDRKTDKNIRESIAEKLGRWRMLHLSNNDCGELYPLMYILRQARTRGPAEFTLYGERFREWSYVWQGGRRLPRVSDGCIGDIVLDNGLLTVKGHADPTAVAVARAMDTKTELPERTELVPAVGNWYKDKDGLRLFPGATGEYNVSTFIEDADISFEPTVRRFYVYHHVVKPVSESLKLRWAPKAERVTSFPYRQKIYCKNEPTMGSLMLYRKELCERTARRIKERERRKAFAEWVVAMGLNGKIPLFIE